MAGQINRNNFDDIYISTYRDTINFIVVKCRDINEVNDILQETYLELWKILCKKEIEGKNIKSFIFGIALNKIKKHNGFLQKIKSVSLFEESDNGLAPADKIEAPCDIEQLVINNNSWDNVWNYLKRCRNPNTVKVFYLYYKAEVKIKDIAEMLNVNESYVKNLLYRTLKDLQTYFKE